MELSTLKPENSNDPLIETFSSPSKSLRWTDPWLLAAVCAVLFGYVAISGRPMTLHEARLPECCREMMSQHNWLIPMNGARPWLERPPFPHWMMIGVDGAIGQNCDREWSARIPPALAGLLIVLMVARIGAGWFGREIGVISGLVLATMFEFYNYSTLSEDDIFLGLLVVAAMAVFVRMEFWVDPSVDDRRLKPLGTRPWRVLVFFLLLGLTNLAKGPIVGAAVIIGTIGVFFLVSPTRGPGEERRRLWRYLWVWGILAGGVIAVSWHWYVHLKYPDPVGGYLANLRYDFSGTTEFDEPWWYYWPTVFWAGLPWTPAAVVAIWLSRRRVWSERDRVMRFLWCWAIVPIVVLSIPHRKHHHYLVPSLAPWAILAALGLRPIARNMFAGVAWSRRPGFGMLAIGLPGTLGLAILGWKRLLAPTSDIHAQVWSGILLVVLLNGCVWGFYHGLWTKNGRWLFVTILIGVGGIYSWKQTHLPDGTVADTEFLKSDVEAAVPRDRLLTIDAAMGPLDFFRVQFYLRGDALVMHNLSYLRSDRIHSVDAYVVARVQDLAALGTLGNAEMVAKSGRRKQKDVPELALFHLVFSADLRRYPPPAVSPMQAMMRQAGPWCGEELPEKP